MSTRQKRDTTPISASTSRTRSRSPADTPAVVTRASAFNPSVIFSAWLARSSRAMPRSTGSAPVSRTAAAIATLLLLMIIPGDGGSPSSISSSPVESTATRTFR